MLKIIMSLFFFFLSFLDGLDTLISNIKTADRKFITMNLNEKDTHGKCTSFFFVFFCFFFQFLGSNALFMGIFDEIEIAMVAICLIVDQRD